MIQQELAAAEATLAALTPAQRNLPACVHPTDPRSAGPDHCEDGTMIVKANPDLFAGAKPGEVRLIFVSSGTGVHKHSID